ncbi:MAG: flagellar hook-associated protein FlgL [bacterium]|jgi:flagellin-like hook-associated protein FlgL
MRITQSILINNFLSQLRGLDTRLAELQRQVSTGNKFDRFGQDPAGAGQVLNIDTLLMHLEQYRGNMEDGRSRMSYLDESLRSVGDYMQRARELVVQGANSHLTANDRRAIALEIDQIVRGVVTLANADYNARYLYAGYQTLKPPFELALSASGSFVEDVNYAGDKGVIARNIGNMTDIDVNFTGKDVFLSQTETRTGRAVSGGALGYSGFFRINGKTISVSATDTLQKIKDRINSTPDIGVVAKMEPNFVLTLESLSARGEIRLEDTGGKILEYLGLMPRGAFNIASAAPALPITDSQGAIKTGAVLAPFPSPPNPGITIDDSNDRLVLGLSGAANNNEEQRLSVNLVRGNYSTVADLADMIQERVDATFGLNKIIVRENAGAIEIETYESGSAITASDLVVGGFDSQGNLDTASILLGLTLAGGPEQADSAGTDGNDKFAIDLGASAHFDGADLDPVTIDIDGDSVATLADLVDSINASIRDSRLAGLVEAYDEGGRLAFETVKTGADVLGTDLAFSDVNAGTLAALGIVNTPSPAFVLSTAPFPPGLTITAGVDDTFSIDLAPFSSGDYSDPAPQAITIAAGAYATAAALAAAINSEILSNDVLANNVEAAVVNIGGFDFIQIQTLAKGSRVDASDLVLADVLPGTLANLGLAGPTTPGAGSSDGQGTIIESANLLDTLLKIRDDLLTVGYKKSLLVDLQNSDGELLGLAPGDRIEFTSGANTRRFYVQKFTTLGDLAAELSDFLGIGAVVSVTGDGRIQVENISNQPVPSISIKAFDPRGGSRAVFDDAFESLSGTVLPLSSKFSSFLVDEERVYLLSEPRLGEVDRDFTTTLDFRSRAGSAVRRLEFALDQSDSFSLELQKVKLGVQGADLTEVIIHLKEQENVLQAALSAGARILQSTLFDFLR